MKLITTTAQKFVSLFWTDLFVSAILHVKLKLKQTHSLKKKKALLIQQSSIQNQASESHILIPTDSVYCPKHFETQCL